MWLALAVVLALAAWVLMMAGVWGLLYRPGRGAEPPGDGPAVDT